ncbi:hypothetical protein BH10BAC3_BH10BAC3_20920 [soil metagenome]
MKKLITSIAAILLFAGISNAAETKENNTFKSAQSTLAPAAESSLVSAKSLTQVIEENTELRLKVEEMTNENENLSSKLDYSKMMHSTISNLQQEVMNDQQENTKSQLDFARMMNATLINLNTLLVSGK